MSIKDLVIANKKKTKTKRMLEVKRYYMSMYRCYMVKMYDLAYISDPTKFNEEEIIKDLLYLGINEVFANTGKISLTSSQVQFAMYKNKSNSEKYEFLSILYNILKYREFSEKVDMLYEEYGFQDSDSAVIRTNIYPRGALITQKSGIVFDEVTARCISSFEDDTKYLSIDNDLWILAMKVLGIPEEDWLSDGIFDGSLCHNEEVECIEGILNGLFKIENGKYTNILIDWLFSHKWSSDVKFKAEMKGLYDYLFSYVNEVETFLMSKMSEISKIKNASLLTIEKDRVYYNIPRKSYKMPFGVFSIVCNAFEEDFLPDGNILNGYTGELYTEDTLTSEGETFAGCPILVNTSVNKTDTFYDLEQTSFKCVSWFGNNDEASIVFDDTVDLNNNPFTVGTTQYDIYKGYLNSLKSADGLINEIKVNSYEEFEKAKKDVFKILSK